ncbi:Rod shape-determining protein MreD [Bernardetia sp.]|uniref:Rod shape-determining protein MreD n=1 Tax=Bernardetia sp. TaxID=1937974 RepID=UPI0025C13A4D|nr:Rod shape-determining protein MreD [Bernardetia sp.]
MNPSSITHTISFFIYWLLQVLFFRNIALFDTAFCFVYIGFLLLLPLETSLTTLLVLGFGMGLAVDVFYDTAGVHAATTVIIAFIRPSIIQFIRPSGGYDNVETPTLSKLGFNWFATYAGIMLFLHHSILFLIQGSSFSLWLSNFLSIIASTILSLFVLIIGQLLFYRSR